MSSELKIESTKITASWKNVVAAVAMTYDTNLGAGGVAWSRWHYPKFRYCPHALRSSHSNRRKQIILPCVGLMCFFTPFLAGLMSSFSPPSLPSDSRIARPSVRAVVLNKRKTEPTVVRGRRRVGA